MKKWEVKQVPYAIVKEWSLAYHYARRVPQVQKAFGLFVSEKLVGVATFGKPASPWLCKGVCGPAYTHEVIELNRVIFKAPVENGPSFLIARAMKQLHTPAIVVSYADVGAWGHTGYIYQALNFLFTGTTKPRTDIASATGGHSRHHAGDRTRRVDRSAKHRYVFFLGTRKEVKERKNALRYPVAPYPKEPSKRYEIT